MGEVTMKEEKNCPYRDMFEQIATIAERKNIKVGDLAVMFSDGVYKGDSEIHDVLVKYMMEDDE